MRFAVRTKFQNVYDNCFEEKLEIADDWQQAFGAFTIYASNPDCIFCSVTYMDGPSRKMALQYNAVEV